MISLNNAARNVIDFLTRNGYCPRLVAAKPMGVALMAAWVKGEADDQKTVKGLENLEILSGKPLKLKDAST